MRFLQRLPRFVLSLAGVADYLRADCFAVYVAPGGDLRDLPTMEQETVERLLNFARSLQIETRILQGSDEPSTLVEFARRERITQIFIVRRKDRGSAIFGRRSLVSRILRLARDMQVTIVAERSA